MIYKQTKAQIDAATLITKDNIKNRGHVWIEGVYYKKQSRLKIYCPKHDEFLITTFDYYNRSKRGCHYCGWELTGEKLKGRQFSPVGGTPKLR